MADKKEKKARKKVKSPDEYPDYTEYLRANKLGKFAGKA